MRTTIALAAIAATASAQVSESPVYSHFGVSTHDAVPTAAPSLILSAASSIISGAPDSQPSGAAPVDAAPGSLSLGETCSADAQCAGNAQCFGSTAMTIRSCGSFNAACVDDTDCATNTCEAGLCSGFLAEEDWLSHQGQEEAEVATSSSVVASYPAGNATAPAGTASGTGAHATATDPAPFEGVAAGKGNVMFGLAGVAVAVAAFVM